MHARPVWAAVLTAVLSCPAAHAQDKSHAAPAAPTASASDPQGMSEAERLLFLHPHLAASRRVQTLQYDYMAHAPGNEPVSDRATLTIAASGDRCCSVHGEFLSGERAVSLPDIPDANSNPILLYFLEGEVRRMQQVTRGQAAHFRKRIRQALVDSATVSDTTVRYASREFPARAVRVAPYRDDPYRARFEREAATEYTFVLSDGVPGGVYQMLAAMPADKSTDPPAARRSLTLHDPQASASPQR